MRIINPVSSITRMHLAYITIGALMVVWTGVWYAYLREYPPQSDGTYYICTGCLISGVTLLVIGLSLSWINQASRRSEQAGVPTVTVAAPGAPPATVAATTAVPAAPVVTAAPGATAPAATAAAVRTPQGVVVGDGSNDGQQVVMG